MIKKLSMFLVFALVFLLCVPGAGAEDGTKAEQTLTDKAEVDISYMLEQKYVPGEIVVVMAKSDEKIEKRKSTAESAAKSISVAETRMLTYNPADYAKEGEKVESLIIQENFRDIYLFVLKDEADMESALNTLNTREDVYCAEPNYIYTPCYTYDASAATLWHLDNIGAGEAWDLGVTGSRNVNVGIIGTGIDFSHPDLASRNKPNLNYNFVTNSRTLNPVGDHETRIAGIIGANTNGFGTSGICKSQTITPVSLQITARPDGAITEEGIVSAIIYAKNNSIKVLNFSYVGFTKSSAIESEVRSYNGLFVSGSGNDGIDIDILHRQILQCNEVPNWIVVGGVDKSNNSIYDYGKKYVDICAPARSIYSTSTGSTYNTQSGTSFSTPMVAAAAALIWSSAPYLTKTEVKDLILNNCETISSLSGKCVTGGKLSIKNIAKKLFTVNRPAGSLGDVVADGQITEQDYFTAKQIYLRVITPTTAQSFAADVDEDGIVSAADYFAIKAHVLGVTFVCAMPRGV